MPFKITEELGWWCTPLFLAVGRLMWESRNFEPKLGSIMRPCYKTKRESVGLVSKILQTELTPEFCHLYNAPAPVSLAIGAFHFFLPLRINSHELVCYHLESSSLHFHCLSWRKVTAVLQRSHWGEGCRMILDLTSSRPGWDWRSAVD